jgi:hypothetical protein
MTAAHRIESKSLVLLQVNCRSMCNKKKIDFCNSVDIYNADVVIGTESWLRKEICNAKVYRADFTTFRTDQCAHGGEVFIWVKNYIACAEVGADKDSEMIAVEEKGKDPKYTWEIICI